MSKVEKLQIQGVRSFGNEASAINIFSPLTLIVGYNGSGKTTIIECLRFATTGELPPNSRGGAFIHDPKLTGENDQWAQVKLQFKAATGPRMVITRNLQLLVKKATRQQKTMECNLVMSKDGEKTSISSRVAELDTIVPQYLGVSKAILDNVIFCHQDDSLWPMSEPSNVKKKFDAIFEAEKYTKAIEGIKQMRKRKRDELENLKIIEEHARQDKDRSERAKRKSTQLSDEIKELREETEVLESRAQEANENAQEALEKVTRFTEVVAVLQMRRKQKDLLVENVERIAVNLEQSSESDEWLESELQSHENRSSILRDKEMSKREECEEISTRIESIRSNQSQKKVDLGRLRERKNAHEKQVLRRNELLRKSAQQYKVRGFEGDLQDTDVDDFLNRLKALHEENLASIKTLQKENEGGITRKQMQIDDINKKLSAGQQARTSLKENISSNEIAIKELQMESNKLSVDEGSSSLAEQEARSLQERLDKAQTELRDAGCEQKLALLAEDTKRLENEKELLSGELVERTEYSSYISRLEYIRKEIRDKCHIKETLLKAHSERMESALGHEIIVSNLKADFLAFTEQKHAELKRLQSERLRSEKDLEEINFQLKSSNDQLRYAHDEMSRFDQLIREASDDGDPDDFLEFLKDLQENRDTRANDVKSFEILKKWYAECISSAQGKHPACRLCKRAFEETRAAEQFVKSLEKQVSNGTLNKLRLELEDMESALQKAQNQRGSYDRWICIKTKDISKLSKQIESLQVGRKASVKKTEDSDRLVRDSEIALDEAQDLSKVATRISEIQDDIASLERKANDGALNWSGNKHMRSLGEIKAEMETLSHKLQDRRSQYVKMQGEERRQREIIAKIEIELGSAKIQLVTVKGEIEKKAAMLRQIHDLRQSNVQHNAKSDAISNEIESFEPQLHREQSQLSSIQRQGRSRETELQNHASDVLNTIRTINRADQEMRSYSDEEDLSKLVKCEADIEELNQEMTLLDQNRKEIAAELHQVQSDLSKKDHQKRIIYDNINYRNACRELKNIETEIDELSKQNAENDHDQYKKECDRWQRAYHIAMTEMTSKKGVMTAKSDQLIQLNREWRKDFKDAATKYRKAHIEVETTKAAIEDLGRYGSALDHAIMKYHSLKMEEINRIVEELWKRTYQGTDVDAILIRSDNESSKGNRNYNYRVCMLKQDAEMDMRGRCSAGQRVLACIIIRLALAECFGINCGLIALDEPTTNLDRDNIRSLAESLHHIINARRGQSNFQLIVITHDEEFLRYMRCSDFCENYFRVQRNDRQKSEIWRNSIADVA